LQIFSKLSVPRRNYYRNRASGLGLAGQANQRFWFGGIDVAELLDLLSFANADVGEFFSAAEHADPASTTRRRTAFHRNRSFAATWINRPPIASLIFGRTPGEVLALTQFVFRAFIILVPGDCPLLVDRFGKTKQTLTVIFRTIAQDLIGRLLHMLLVENGLAGRGLEGGQACLQHGHKSSGRDANQQ